MRFHPLVLFLFQICMHVTAGKKCQYIGNCTFAHSVEERDLWTYMKENNSEISAFFCPPDLIRGLCVGLHSHPLL